MKRSTHRILTTHVGSLPRPDSLVQMGLGKDQREFRADPMYETGVRHSIAEMVRKQSEVGLDVINDGEMSKRGFSRYVTERITGFDGPPMPMPAPREAKLFPEYYASNAPGDEDNASCNGPIEWHGDDFVKFDIANLKAAAQGVRAEELFMTAVAPGQVCHNFMNSYYPSHEKYVLAVADALKHEYKAIVDAGIVLQLDSPELTLTWGNPEYEGKTFAEYRRLVALHIDLLNHALQGLPADRIRMHLCWGNGEKPHVHDIPIAEIIDEVYKANVGALSFEGSNPRHAHEWKIFKDHPLPDDKAIIPGCIDTLTNFVEHPELVAERIERYANVVGKERVIAGTDCGFSTRVRSKLRVHPTVVWAKLKSLTEGARIASERLWH